MATDFNKLLRDSGVISGGHPMETRIAQAKLALGIQPSQKEMKSIVNSQYYEQQAYERAFNQGQKDAQMGFNTAQSRLYEAGGGSMPTKRVRFTADELLAANQPGTEKPKPETPRMPGMGEMVEYGGKQYTGYGYKPTDQSQPSLNIAGVAFPATAQQRDVMGLKDRQALPLPTKVPSLISTTPRTANVGPMSQVPTGGYGLPSPTVSMQRRGGGTVVPVTPTQVQPDSPFSPAPYQEKTLNEIMSPFQPAPYNERDMNDIMSPFNIAPTRTISLEDVMSPFNIAPTQQTTLDEVMSPFSPAPVSEADRMNQAKRYIAESGAMAKTAAPAAPAAAPSQYEHPAYSLYGIHERLLPAGYALDRALESGNKNIRAAIEGLMSGNYATDKVMFGDVLKNIGEALAGGESTVEMNKGAKPSQPKPQPQDQNQDQLNKQFADKMEAERMANPAFSQAVARNEQQAQPTAPTQVQQAGAAPAPVASAAPVQPQPAPVAQVPQPQRVASAMPQAQQGFAPQQYNPMAAFQGPGSISESLYGKEARARFEHQQKMQLDTYKANVNASSKNLRDALHVATQSLDIKKKESDLLDAQLKRQFNANPNLNVYTADTPDGGKLLFVKNSEGHFTQVKTERDQPSGVWVHPTDGKGNEITDKWIDAATRKETGHLDFLTQMMAAGGGMPMPMDGAAKPAAQQPRSFNTVQEAEAANLPKGTKIIVNGRPATVK